MTGEGGWPVVLALSGKNGQDSAATPPLLKAGQSQILLAYGVFALEKLMAYFTPRCLFRLFRLPGVSAMGMALGERLPLPATATGQLFTVRGVSRENQQSIIGQLDYFL